MVRIDLHTHSYASPDGALRTKDYKKMLASGRLTHIAVTDHNRIDFALELQAELGDCIIVGEEISAQEGEIIGLYLRETVPAGLTTLETAEQIHAQGGLVYIPHPFETRRKGLSTATMKAIAKHIDIVETCNGRTLQNRSKQAEEWATGHTKPGAASSDAHGVRGWGNTYSRVTKEPTTKTLVRLLRSAIFSTKSTGAIGRAYPKLNRLRRHR